MDLNDARHLRDHLEAQIRELIEVFEARTSCEVWDMDLIRTKPQGVGHRRRSELTGVRALTELSRTAAPVPDGSG